MRLSADKPFASPGPSGVPSFTEAGVEHDRPPTQRLRRIRRRNDLDFIQNPWIAI
jgi:hypothetical protein